MSNVQSTISEGKSYIQSVGIRCTTLDSSQHSLRRHKTHWFQTWTTITKSLNWRLPFEFHTGVVPVVLRNNYHKVLTTTNTTLSYTYHTETHDNISSHRY